MSPGLAGGQTTPAAPFTPVVGQEGKDVVWVPTPEVLVQKMLDMVRLTPQDLVMDLGSGDGRMIIAAAKRGARAIGVEYNPKMVELSRRTAASQGVADKATFIQGDMFEADVSKASVLALFLLPDNLNRLRAKFLDMRPGSRIVVNTFAFEGWEPDATESVEGDSCSSWCSALVWIVPAKVNGTWRLPQGEIAIKQTYQKVEGTLTLGGTATPITGKMNGDQIAFKAGDAEYSGKVSGDTMTGTSKSGSRNESWRATRASQ
jgi:precorrin-6B methylase 2